MHHWKAYINLYKYVPTYVSTKRVVIFRGSLTIVIINKETYRQKVNKFLHENQYMQPHEDPSETYHKKTQLAIESSNLLIDKQKRKHLTHNATSTYSKRTNQNTQRQRTHQTYRQEYLCTNV
jgi:hypothetical protein